MSEVTTPQEPAEVQGGFTEDQAVQHLLGKWQTTPEPPQEEATEESEPEQAQADTPDADEPADEPQEEADTEIDIAGEKFRLPASLKEHAKRIEAKAKEVEAGATKRFQEAADLRKATEAERVAVTDLRKAAEANADLIADYKMIGRRLQQLEGIDIQNTDSDTLTRLNAEYNQLQAAKLRVEQAMNQSVSQMKDAEAKALRARQEHAESVVKTRIKDWGPEKAKRLAEYAVGRGAPQEALNGITEPWMVEILEDAAYGRQMREHKATLDKRVVQTQPTLKPGASAAQPKGAAQAQMAMDRLKKSHSMSDGVAALLARSRKK